MPILKNRLSELRKSKGYMQEDVARYAGVSVITVSSHETMASAIPRNTLDTYATLFGVQTVDIFHTRGPRGCILPQEIED